MTSTTGLPVTQHVVLDIQGMKCGGCVRAIEKHLQTYPGVLAVTVNLATRQAQVLADATQVTPEKLAQFLTQRGFPSQPRHLWDSPVLSPKQSGWQLALAVGLLWIAGLGHVPWVDILPALQGQGFFLSQQICLHGLSYIGREV